MFDYKKFEAYALEVSKGDDKTYAAMVDAVAYLDIEYKMLVACREFASHIGELFCVMTGKSIGTAFVNGIPVASVTLKSGLYDYYEIDTEEDGYTLNTYAEFIEKLKTLDEPYMSECRIVYSILNGDFPEWASDVHIRLSNGKRVAIENFIMAS